MRARLLAVVLALALLLPALAGCAARDEAECPVTEFDCEQTVEREEGLAVTLKQKTVTLENENAELIRVENGSDKAVNVDVIAKFTEDDGTLVSIDTTRVTAIPAHYAGFVILSPGTRYGVCELFPQIEEYEGETLMQYLTQGYGLGLALSAWFNLDPGLKSEKDVEIYDLQADDNSVACYLIEHEITSASDRDIHATGLLLGLDSEGNGIFLMRRSYNLSKGYHVVSDRVPLSDHPWDDDMTVPENLLGDLYCIYAIDFVEWEDDFQERNAKLLEEITKKQEKENDKKEG